MQYLGVPSRNFNPATGKCWMCFTTGKADLPYLDGTQAPLLLPLLPRLDPQFNFTGFIPCTYSQCLGRDAGYYGRLMPLVMLVSQGMLGMFFL